MTLDVDATARDRLAGLLDLPLPLNSEQSGSTEYFDPWDAFDGIVGAYSSEIDRMAIETLTAVRDRKTLALLKDENSLFVEFFLHILAGHNYVDYGTSPRGAFPNHSITDEMMDAWIEKWKAWYTIEWCEGDE